MKKPLIGVIGSLILDQSGLIPIERSYVNDHYIRSVEKAGGCPVVLPVVYDKELIESQIQMCDGLVFTGGIDIHPKFYGTEGNRKNGFNDIRIDQYQLEAMKRALEYDKPSICVCRGLQLLNIVCGGNLIQDISEVENSHLQHVQESRWFEVSHKVKVSDNTVLRELFDAEIWVNSFHHQCLGELGKELKISAVASDGIIEAIEHVNKKLFLGVQWHPEMMIEYDDSMLPIFERLIETI
jgi:putative glutamine amidotransferase